MNPYQTGVPCVTAQDQVKRDNFSRAFHHAMYYADLCREQGDHENADAWLEIAGRLLPKP